MLSQYWSLDKGLKTSPGAVLVISPIVLIMVVQLKQPHLEEQPHTKPGIDKKYFKGKAYEELRSKVKDSCRYARSKFKGAVRVHFSFHQSLTDNIW